MEKNMERVRAMLGISFYLYEVGSARAPKRFPWLKAIEESIKRQREVKFVFGNREVGC